MGQIHKVGDVYYIEFQARGLTYSQVAGNRRQDAERLLEKIESQIADGESLTTVRQIDLDVFICHAEAYLDAHFSPLSKGRFLKLWQHWRVFLSKEYPHVRQLSELTPAMVESYKVFLSASLPPKHVNFSLLLLREILEYGIRTGFINDNPSLHTSLLQTKNVRRPETLRARTARDLLARSVSLQKVCSILKLKDVARVMYWSNFIPLIREDVYN